MARMVLSFILMVFTGSACATVIPKDVMQKVNGNITFEALKRDPTAYKGEMVLLAGVIVKNTNSPKGTTLEIYQTQMDWEKRPVHKDVSEGRFLAESKDFLDPEIYGKQREVTIAGTVQGIKFIKLSEMAYPYPVIRAKAIHLWKKAKPLPYEPWYPMGAPWGPWGFWGPWYGPPYWYY